MNALLLGGNGARNKEWIHRVGEQVQDLFGKTVVHDYRHWSTGERFIDLEYELGEIAAKAKLISPYTVFAKSIGTVLTMRALSEDVLAPRRCVFAGLPLKLMAEPEAHVTNWGPISRIPLVVLQNEHDPYGTPAEVEAFLKGEHGLTDFVVRSLPGNEHDYDDLPAIRAALDWTADTSVD